MHIWLPCALLLSPLKQHSTSAGVCSRPLACLAPVTLGLAHLQSRSARSSKSCSMPGPTCSSKYIAGTVTCPSIKSAQPLEQMLASSTLPRYHLLPCL